jgi:nucleobase:cation symporter-1, NCS1 family
MYTFLANSFFISTTELIKQTANSFISAISGYAVFLGPLTGIMVTEYHIIRRRRIKLSHLYLPNQDSDYW